MSEGEGALRLARHGIRSAGPEVKRALPAEQAPRVSLTRASGPRHQLTSQRRVRIPRTQEQVNVVEALPLLPHYAQSRPEAAVAVLRAARLYQDALWISDSDLSQAWVQLVSTLESAAGAWRPTKLPPIDRLRLAWSRCS